MPRISAVMANVEVADLDESIPLYQRLSGVTEVTRFPFQDLELAVVGPFLLVAGAVDRHPTQVATLVVGSITEVLAALDGFAEVLEGPEVIPAGTRVVARHPGGTVFEYIEPA